MDLAIIGLDGLDPDLVEEWSDELPNLRRMIEAGKFGRIRSSDPPLSAPAWPWMFTGKQGGKHGCFGFTKRQPDSYSRKPVNFSDVHAESLWEALDVAGVPCGVVNVPLTYPPSELENGYVIAGWPVPNRVTVGNPPDIVDELEAAIGERYRVNPFPMGPELKQAEPDRVVDHITDGINHHRRAFSALLSARSVDVFFCVFMATDVAGHHLCFDHDRLREVYIEQDRAVGDLLEGFEDDVDVIVLGDHGHGAESHWKFFANEWLREQGYLTLERGRSTDVRATVLRRLGLTVENLLWLKNAIGIGDVRELLPQRVFDLVRRTVPTADFDIEGFDPERVDWTDTVAYASNQNVISLNSRKVHPSGTVSPAEAAPLIEDIVSGLRGIEHPDPEREDALFSEIIRKEDVFEGPYADEAPAVVAIADEMHCPVLTGFNDGQRFSDNRWGEHRQYGALITSGPSFSSGERADDCAITDVFPLALGLLDLPIPEDVDGGIPVDRLQHDIEPTYRSSRDDQLEAGGRTYSIEERSDVEEQLRGLGYLE